MMPRIEAGKRLSEISDGAIAAGNLPKLDARRILQRLEEAQSGARRRAARPTPAVLASMGIGVVSAPSRSSETGANDG